MPHQQTVTKIRLENISTSVTITVNTLNVLVNTLKIHGLEAMINTTQSLLNMVQTIKQDKNECAELMEQTHNILNAIIGVYVKSDTGIELPPSILNEIGNFTQTLHKIHTFLEAQQSGSKVKKFFRQGELNGLLKDCKAGLQQRTQFFQIKTFDTVSTAREMEKQAQMRHQEVLNAIETISSSDSASSISKMYSSSYASSNSISMLPAEPKIFHGRESELANILNHFMKSTPKIAILGAGGMGKTSLAQTVLHHQDIMIKYQGSRLFVVCDTAATKVELAGLIGAHLGMKPGKDLTQAVIRHLGGGPPTLLVLDNLETAWEPAESRKGVEEFLSLLTDIAGLALIITMRGAERPHKVQWTRPFLPPLEPLAQEAARKVFLNIAEDRHSIEEMDQVLGLTDNMPLSINLLAHAVDVEGCTAILTRWQREHTSVISEGYDQRSNLELSISLSLASPRITSTPHSQELLSLLSILPDGLSDAELMQSNFAIQDILDCKRALVRTALAYTDDHQRLKALIPIREYMAKFLPPTDRMIRSLLKHFQGLLQAYELHWGKESLALYVDRLSPNCNNILNIIQNGLQPGHPDLADSIFYTSQFIRFSESANIRKEVIPLMNKVITLLPHSEDQRANTYFTVRLFGLQDAHSIPHPEKLIAQTFEWLKMFDDPDLEAIFFGNLSHYYSVVDTSTALKYCEMGLSLAKSHGNIRGQCAASVHLAWIKWLTAEYITSRTYAKEVQRLAKVSGNLQHEAAGLYSEALSCQALGHFRECNFLVMRALSLVELCGLSRGALNHSLITCQAELYTLKSEYIHAWNLHSQLLQTYQGGQLGGESIALINIAGTEVLMGVSYDVIQKKIDTSQDILQKLANKRLLTACDMVQADLNLREGDMSCFLFCKCLKFGWGKFNEVVSYCLERLADVTCWGTDHELSWSTVFLAHSLRAKEMLGIHKALQFVGDVHLMQSDEVTAVNLFTIALEGFTEMDVHRSRAECMIRLGDIAKKNGDLLKALELWETARPLFECSSQTKKVQDINERVSGMSEKVKEEHRKNLARLAELNVPTGKVEEVDGDTEELELEEEAELIVA
ncbi:hypothetical protein B0H16DRAFT_732635 [Mycena metata]|uniref:Novel STAND NTPase 1 domain-containing protein n=3 Tax=Mycena metata TaxID=1033252 RepID=A0AAD7J3E7_9AGAR|nr:hypothetical protein B0H16DRAFT_732635 [Mycena metata]